jgi:hypothetical protein
MRELESISAIKIADNENFGFSPDEYSKFKFGSKNIARKFGYELAQMFINQLIYFPLQGKQIVVLPSAYSHIQTASCLMKTYFVDRLNLYLFENGFTPVEEAKIYRTVTYREDYGEMSAEQRYNLISGDKFHVDKTFLEGKILVFIDDIKITGTHERIITKMLDDFDIQNKCFMLYLAELKNPDMNPRIENYLNHHFVNNLDKLHLIIKNNDFVFNTRVVKYILNSDHKECIQFLKKQNEQFIRDLFYLSIGNEYYKFDSYCTNLSYINKLVSEFKSEENHFEQKPSMQGLIVAE